VSCSECGRERKQTFHSILQELPEIGSFRTIHQGSAIPIKREGCKNKKVFKSNLYHQWFLCMWTSGRRKKLQKYAKQYEAVIVLGCESATETVRELVKSTDCKVFEGMEVAGIMNAKPRFHLPCNISFEDCKIIPISQQKKEENVSG
jgi:hypothetical protein